MQDDQPLRFLRHRSGLYPIDSNGGRVAVNQKLNSLGNVSIWIFQPAACCWWRSHAAPDGGLRVSRDQEGDERVMMVDSGEDTGEFGARESWKQEPERRSGEGANKLGMVQPVEQCLRDVKPTLYYRNP